MCGNLLISEEWQPAGKGRFGLGNDEAREISVSHRLGRDEAHGCATHVGMCSFYEARSGYSAQVCPDWTCWEQTYLDARNLIRGE